VADQQSIDVDFEFVPPGTTAEPEQGRVYVDVGNAFGPGVLDHHAPGTPGACTAELALQHPEFVLSQVVAAGQVTIVTHRYPDLDAISGAYFALNHLRGQRPDAAARAWAAYVCAVDRGETRLDPARPINPYSVLMMRLNRVADESEDEAEASRRMLEVGLDFVDTVLRRTRQGVGLDDPALLEREPAFSRDVWAVLEDHARYLDDVARADRFVCELPRQAGEGTRAVPGLWIDRPRARLFKSWARGDTRDKARPDGYVFTGVQVSEDRAIVSVAPDSGVTLHGLGRFLEAAETAKRERLGCPRTGPDREGFDSPDPWYDGRSPFHGYTIVDAPRTGTVLLPTEIRRAFEDFLAFVERGSMSAD
jgi:hypothetical protein